MANHSVDPIMLLLMSHKIEGAEPFFRDMYALLYAAEQGYYLLDLNLFQRVFLKIEAKLNQPVSSLLLARGPCYSLILDLLMKFSTLLSQAVQPVSSGLVAQWRRLYDKTCYLLSAYVTSDIFAADTSESMQ